MTTLSLTQGTNPFGESFVIYWNQSILDTEGLGPVIRFTADAQTKRVFGWNFNEGHHSDASRALGLNDHFSSPDFLRGAAERIDGKYVFVSSDFLASFKGRLTGEDRRFLTELLGRDWSWLDQYIEITPRLRRF